MSLDYVPAVSPHEAVVCFPAPLPLPARSPLCACVSIATDPTSVCARPIFDVSQGLAGIGDCGSVDPPLGFDRRIASTGRCRREPEARGGGFTPPADERPLLPNPAATFVNAGRQSFNKPTHLQVHQQSRKIQNEGNSYIYIQSSQKEQLRARRSWHRRLLARGKKSRHCRR